ncbi:MAG: TIM barrel protein [Verrucomicrobia bacterium]|nr:TIM barrel protein [Verrucomicrobiota bacterium]
MPRFDANLTWLFQEKSFFERFAAAANAGFTGIEILFPYNHPASEIRAALQANGQELVLLNAPPGDFAAGERGLAAVPGREKDFREMFGQALDYAETLACQRIHVMSGITRDVNPTEADRTFLANLEYALQKVEHSGVTVLLEPINLRDFPGYYLTTVEQADRVLQELRHPSLKIQLDWYHTQIMGGDLARRTEKFFSEIGHFQLAGVPDRAEPDSGEVYFPYLFHLVDSLHYDGWIGCEYRPKGRTEDGLGWIAKTSYAGST